MVRLSLFCLLLLCCVCRPTKQNTQAFDGSKNYQRVIASNLFSAEIAWFLGPDAQKRIIAVPQIVDDTRYSDQILNKWPKNIHRIYRATEEMVSLKPDLVIVASFLSVETRSLIQRLKIDMVSLDSFTGFTAYKNNVRKIASALNARKKGEAIIKQFEKRLKKVRERARKMKPLTVMSYLYGSTMGSNSTFHDAVTAAGLQNRSAQAGIKRYKNISVEELRVYDPDVIVTSCGKISCAHAEKNLVKKLGLKQLRAQIIAIPSNTLASTNERMLVVAETLQSRLNN